MPPPLEGLENGCLSSCDQRRNWREKWGFWGGISGPTWAAASGGRILLGWSLGDKWGRLPLCPWLVCQSRGTRGPLCSRQRRYACRGSLPCPWAPSLGPLLGKSCVVPPPSWCLSPDPGPRSSAWRPGGSRVSERPLVSSTKVELVRAHLGTTSLTGIGGNPVKMGLKRAVLHPQYNPSILDFDVAVLELAGPLDFNKYIQPVCLPLAIQKFPVGRKCMISGWGNTQEGNGELPTGLYGPTAADHAPPHLPPGSRALAHGWCGCFIKFVGASPTCSFTDRL